MEIVLIALVAVFLVLRLRSVLGRRTGNERPPARDPFGPPGDAGAPGWTQGRPADAPAGQIGGPPKSIDPPRPAAPTAGVRPPVVEAQAMAGVGAIRGADPGFDPVGFAQGARAAFEMIVAAFARGDSATLRPLLSDATFASFDQAIRDRQGGRQTLETTLIGFESSDVVGADLRGREAQVTVRFVTEQINVTRGPDGLVVDGNPNEVAKVTDVWTFSRDTSSRDPNWRLVNTATED